jgi:hypothetical protein
MKAVCLIFWMIISLILVCSVIGLVLFIPKDIWENHENTPSTWSTIGRKLLDAVIR